MSIFLEAASDAAIWSDGPGTLATVFGLLAVAAALNNPLWKEPDVAKQAATAAHYVVKDSSNYAWFGCTDTNAFSLYQTRFTGTDAAGHTVDGVVCRSAFSDENQVVVKTKSSENGAEHHNRTVSRVHVSSKGATLLPS